MTMHTRGEMFGKTMGPGRGARTDRGTFAATLAVDRGVLRTRLDNGLTVILKEMHTAPVISTWVWYRVGSRNESSGRTGVSHWVEHMQFKGTSRYPAGTYDRLLSREGGVFNAMTWLDYTAYFETLPASRVDLALDIEADRMVNSLFDPDEVERERTVIISERSMNENRPTFLLAEEVQSTAIKAHPYHHEIIGWLSDLQAMTRDDLYEHYRTYYAPNNAVLVLVGAFDADAMLERVKHYFADLEPRPLSERAITEEPPQRGERRVLVQGAGDTHYVQMAFHSVPATHPDFFPMVVLDAILGGAKSFGGGGASNRSSRLYRGLVMKGLAADADSWVGPTIDPYLWWFDATVSEGRTPEEVEAALWQEIERVQQDPVSPEELAKAVKQVRAHFVYGAESITNQARWLGFAEIVTSQEWLATYLDRVAAVTAEDVQRVAQTYLRRDQVTVGWYIATSDEPGNGRRHA